MGVFDGNSGNFQLILYNVTPDYSGSCIGSFADKMYPTLNHNKMNPTLNHNKMYSTVVYGPSEVRSAWKSALSD